jgi:hypothetical protein
MVKEQTFSETYFSSSVQLFEPMNHRKEPLELRGRLGRSVIGV